MDIRSATPGSTSISGWDIWQKRAAYLCTPENSASAESAAVWAKMPRWIARLKALVWIGVSLAAALAIAQL